MREVEGEYIVALQIAHIYGLEPGSARHLRSMSDDERNSFANLIFLCFPHHRKVDGNEADYPADVLLSWKSQQESPGIGSLHGLRSLTEDKLQEMIQKAYAERNDEISSTLSRLEEQGDGAANLIRELLAELAQLRTGGRPLLDADVVTMLDEASQRLVHLQDSAGLAFSAAQRLAGLSDTISALDAAADNLRRARGPM